MENGQNLIIEGCYLPPERPFAPFGRGRRRVSRVSEAYLSKISTPLK
ncbi:MAG: hypothetical protein ACLRSW_14605 [Christensenellaceae bacterium]